MIISDYTYPELEFFRAFCNFDGDESTLFELRAAGYTLDQCAELLNRELSGTKKLSAAVNRKMQRAQKCVNMENWIAKNFS